MKVALVKLSGGVCHTKEERAARRRAAYLFLRDQVGAVCPDLVLAADPASATAPFAKDPMGKPYLPGHPEVLLNLSHSKGGYAAAIVAKRGVVDAVGIDVEDRFPYQDLLARRICAQAEWAKLEAEDTREGKGALLNLYWSRKEAYLKCLGCGIRCSLKEVDTETIDRKRYVIREDQTPFYTLVACLKKSEEY